MSVTIPRVEEVPEVLAAVLAAVSRVHEKLIKERYG